MILIFVLFSSIFLLSESSPLNGTRRFQIVGGTTIDIKTVPYQISLEYNGALLCGGTIISETIVITAAHCKAYPKKTSYKVRAGTNTTETGGVVYAVKTFKVHPKYNKNTMINDIAYIKTKTAITFTDSIQKVTLPSASSTTKGPFLITGWGTTSSGGSISTVLLSASVDLVPDATCKSNYGSGSILSGMICAAASGKDTCQGDSGGPMVEASSKILYGITSWGNGCAQAGYPGVYTSVPYFRDWIKSKTKV